MKHLATAAALAALALFPPAAAHAQEVGPATAPAEAPSDAQALLERVAVVGASVTAGFGLDGELEASASLASFVDAALVAEHGPVESLGNAMFFMNPLEVGAQLLARAGEAEPTALVAVDFLFWYGYGTLDGEAARLARFELGLEALSRFECPMVVADLPDARPALKGSSPFMGGGPIIGADQIPSRETLTALNDRLRDWAASRPNVIVLPLAGFLDRLRSGEPQRVAGLELGEGDLQKLLQPDLLHPTVEGTALIALFALDALRARYGLSDDAIAETTAPIVEEIVRSTEAEREKRRERARKREEKRRAREEKKEREAGGGDDPLGLSISLAPGRAGAR